MYCEGLEDVPFSDEDPDLIGDRWNMQMCLFTICFVSAVQIHLTVNSSLFVHRLVGGLLTQSSEYGFVLEDDEGICGYALGTVDVKPFIKKCKLSWIPFMQEKYNKPDCQKDLTEAEVEFLIHFFYYDNSSGGLLSFTSLSLSVVPVEDDAEFPRRGGGSSRLFPLQLPLSY